MNKKRIELGRILKTSLLFSVLMFFPPFSLSAWDFGLIVNQNAGYGFRGGNENVFEYQADIMPRFSFLAGDWGEFLFSAGFTLGEDDGFYFVPELLNTGLSMRFGNSMIKAGRIPYADPLSFIASGLFDGVQFSHNTRQGTFSLGAWYTGLLYKKNANITMTESDLERYNSVLDFDDFYNTYFAPPRLLVSFDWEHPSVAELVHLRAAVTGQADLSDASGKYHSEYLTVKAGIPVKSFLFEVGGSMETAQKVTAQEMRFNMAFAWDLGIFWDLPTSFNSRLSLVGHFAGIKTDDFMEAFVPITSNPYGNILEVKLSGLSVIDLNYTARLSDIFGTSLSSAWFVRNDLETFKNYPAAGSESYLLGTEIFARLICSPSSDLHLSAGGGVFLPITGNKAVDEKPLWRVELTMAIAIF